MKTSKLKISVIVTVFNEEETILSLLDALRNQTYPAAEIVIVDGGSSDQTLQLLKTFQSKNKKVPLHIFSKKGNRSVGRNEAIRKTTHELIAITDAGCIPHTTWLEAFAQKILEKNLLEKNTEFVVAGYYEGKAKSNFEEAVIPYVLVMPDRVNPTNFLPATRSFLLTKNIWEKFGGFDEELCDNEDYAFSMKLQRNMVPIHFASDAVVIWIPRTTIAQFWVMIFRFARGDVTAGIIRPKVLLIFLRYLLLFLFALALWKYVNVVYAATLLIIFFASYFLWSITKNKKYVPHGWYWLPVLQVVSDFAVMWGSLAGTFQYFFKK
jgi:glycosyltransferase involved in cell wall biosynthesis